MPTFRFTITIPGDHPMTDDIANALYEAGCDDGSPWSCEGVLAVDFDREAEELGDAIGSAVKDVQRAGFSVALIHLSAEDVPRATEADRERLRKAMEGPIDTSDSPEKKGTFR